MSYEACDDYERPVVTDVYKYPDELFDSHSYKKGAWVLHMIRNIVNEENFKMGLRNIWILLNIKIQQQMTLEK